MVYISTVIKITSSFPLKTDIFYKEEMSKEMNNSRKSGLYSQKQYSSRISNICYVSGGEDR
jgi:hypothetical protein